MFGSLGNLTGLMKTAKELQSNIAKVQNELAAKRYSAEAGGGLVAVTVDGRCNLVDVKIAAEATGDVELLEDLVKAAVCSAVNKAQDGMKKDMASVTGGIEIPGLSSLLGGA